MIFDELDGGIGEDIAAIAVRLLIDTVVRQDRIEVSVARRIGWLDDASAAMHQRFREALVDGSRRIIVSQVPFAEDAGVIAGRGEHFSQRDFLGGHGRSAEKSVDRAGAVVVAARQQAGAWGLQTGET